MKTKRLSALAVVAILLVAVLAPAMGLSLLNDSNSSFPVPVTPTPSPSVEEGDNNATDTDTDTEANETEIIDDEISLPPLSENLEIIGKDSFGANETPEFFIQIQQDFIDAISDADSGNPVQVQIYVEGCNGSRIELFVEEEETSNPSSNISIYRVTISNNKTGLETEEITPGIYTLVVAVGEQSVEHPFEWGVEPEPTYVEPQPQNVTVNVTTKPVLTAKKKHFVLNENPTFKFKFNYKTKNESKAKAKTNETGLKALALAISEPRKALKTWVTSEEIIKTSVYYKDELLDIEPEIEKVGEGEFNIEIPSKRAFRAGLYKLKVELVTDNKTYVEEQDFTWGVLAINTHKSIYLPGETAFIGIAVLDNEGHTVCDADVTLTITDTDNKETVLSTGNGLINVSPQCSVYGVTNLPDYYTNYTVGGVGTYVMTLTAVTPDGTKSITDEFTVQSSVDFDVARSGPTRIYPPVPYVMKFTIKANKNYNGLIKEYVPASFDITPQDGLTVSTVGDAKILLWNKNLAKGENYNIYYEFDAPDRSPYLFLLGRLQIGCFEERRDWMIASDAPTVETRAPTSCDSGWTDCANAYTDNAAYAYKSSIGAGQWSAYDFSVPTGATINSVKVKIKSYVGDDKKHSISLKVYNGASWGSSHSVTAVEACTEETIDVSSDFSWTAAMVNGIEVELTATIGAGAGASKWTRCCYLPVEVNYTADTEAPTYTNDGDNSTGSVTEGAIVETHVYWTDADSDLGKAVLRTNKTGSWENESWHTFTTDPEWANFTIDTTGHAGKTICWVQWANDTSNNWNTSMSTTAHCFNVISAADTTPPTWQNQGQNNSAPAEGEAVLLYAQGKDETALDFAILETNETGGWLNITDGSYGSPMDMADATDWTWSNFTWQNSSITAGTTVGWRIWYNDTSDNWNKTDLMSFAVQDVQAPQWSDPQKNKTTIYEGDYVKFSANWTDDVGLSGYKFAINQSGTWVNSSFTSFSGTFNVSENVTQITAPAGTTVQWRFYANDTSDNGNVTDVQTFVVEEAADTTPPQWSDPQKNKTTIYEGDYVKFTANWTDDVALDGYKLSINQTGTWVNSSFTEFSGTFNISENVTQITAPAGTTVGWRFYANDTSDNGNVTDIQSFVVQSAEVITPVTPYMVYGRVFCEDGSECTNPTVKITNLNNSKQWTAKTNASYNFYQITLAGGTDLNATEMLQFNVNAPDASQFNTTHHTVTPDEIDSGGLFSFNITLEAPETPFIIYGWVNYSNGTACNGPTVTITNTNTSITWQAETNASYNYYQLILGTKNVSAGNVLKFNATDGTQFNVTNHTVMQDDINNGGLFDFNLTLPSPITEGPTVDSITITPDDDNSTVGVQINPTPGGNKTVNITAVVSDLNGWDDVDTVVAVMTGPDTVADSPVSLTFVSNSSLMTATYNGTFNMSFYYANGTYTVDVTATDNGSLTGSNFTTFEYQTAIGLELDSTLINFSCSGPIDPGETSAVLGDEDMETLNNATVRNIGNVAIDIEVNGTNMTSAGNIITKDNIEARINETSYLDMSVTRCFDVNMSVGFSSLNNTDFKLYVPYGTPMGNYRGTITLTPVQS